VAVTLMRRLSIALLVLMVLATTAGTAPAVVAKTAGATYVQLSAGAGFASVRSRGNFFGQVKRGRIVATTNVHVNGCESRRGETASTHLCRGRHITFDTFGGGKWRVRLHGRGIYGSGFVRGCLVLNGRDTGPPGSFRRSKGGEWRDWPRKRTAYTLGTGTC
jgi:hypothetical protein